MISTGGSFEKGPIDDDFKREQYERVLRKRQARNNRKFKSIEIAQGNEKVTMMSFVSSANKPTFVQPPTLEKPAIILKKDSAPGL